MLLKRKITRKRYYNEDARFDIKYNDIMKRYSSELTIFGSKILFKINHPLHGYIIGMQIGKRHTIYSFKNYSQGLDIVLFKKRYSLNNKIVRVI